jgi:hypothetical protein
MSNENKMNNGWGNGARGKRRDMDLRSKAERGARESKRVAAD